MSEETQTQVAAAARAEYQKRLERAKNISAALVKWTASPSATLMPSELRGALGELAVLVVDLAQLSHAQFDMRPFELGRMQGQIDELRGLSGEGGLPALASRVARLEKVAPFNFSELVNRLEARIEKMERKPS